MEEVYWKILHKFQKQEVVFIRKDKAKDYGNRLFAVGDLQVLRTAVLHFPRILDFLVSQRTRKAGHGHTQTFRNYPDRASADRWDKTGKLQPQ